VEKGFLNIGVKDTGIGIDSEVEGKIFEPLFTTNNRVVGLVLALAQSIITSHYRII
jgi:signal transduction histidine kinase